MASSRGRVIRYENPRGSEERGVVQNPVVP